MKTRRIPVCARALLAPVWYGALLDFIMAAGLVAAESPARGIVKAAGVEAGLAVVVGTTDGVLETTLTTGSPSASSTGSGQASPGQGRMLVQGLALSDAAAAAARQHLFNQKLYGLASVSRVQTVKTLPYYDRIVNLLVADLDTLGNDAPSMDEIQRVLGYEGVAYLKQGGQWTKTVKPTPKDVDTWTHFNYDASGNPVSKDLVVGPPNTFRWVDGPLAMNLIGGFRTSDGVAVQINEAFLNSHGRSGIPPELQGLRLWARDVNSGVLLWHRPVLPVTARYTYAATYTETFVAAGGRVYIYDFTAEDAVALTALNLRTGAVERVFDQGVVCRKADWPGGLQKGADWRAWASDFFAMSSVLVHDSKVVQVVRGKLLVMDAASGKVLWEKAAEDATEYIKAVITGKRLVVLRSKVAYGEIGGGPPGVWRARKTNSEAARSMRFHRLNRFATTSG
jgi:hypothetical protein